MKKLLLLLVLILPWHASAADLPPWVNAEVAQKYAEAALIEWAAWSHYPLDRERLASDPLVLARVGNDGTRVVQVVYRDGKGAYFVVLTADNDNTLDVFSCVATVETPEYIAASFMLQILTLLHC